MYLSSQVGCAELHEAGWKGKYYLIMAFSFSVQKRLPLVWPTHMFLLLGTIKWINFINSHFQIKGKTNIIWIFLSIKIWLSVQLYDPDFKSYPPVSKLQILQTIITYCNVCLHDKCQQEVGLNRPDAHDHNNVYEFISRIVIFIYKDLQLIESIHHELQLPLFIIG